MTQGRVHHGGTEDSQRGKIQHGRSRQCLEQARQRRDRARERREQGTESRDPAQYRTQYPVPPTPVPVPVPTTHPGTPPPCTRRVVYPSPACRAVSRCTGCVHQASYFLNISAQSRVNANAGSESTLMLAQQRTWPVGFSPRQRPGPLPCRVAGPGPLSSPCRRLALVLFGIVVLGKGVNSAKRSIRQRGVWQRGVWQKSGFGKRVG